MPTAKFGSRSPISIPAASAWNGVTLLRSYSNRLNVNTDFGNGYNWLIEQLPYVADDPDGSIAVVFNSTVAYWFDLVAGNYIARYGAKQPLTLTSSNFTLTFPDGEVWTFYPLDAGMLAGKFQTATPPGGDGIATANYNSFSTLTNVRRAPREAAMKTSISPTAAAALLPAR